MLPIIVMYILLVPSMLLFIYNKYNNQNLQATIFKGVSTWIILGAALAGTLGAYGAASFYAALIIAGLAMGLAGDVALSLPDPGLKSGIVFFGLGHCCYIAALMQISMKPWLGVPVFVVVYGLLLFFFLKSRRPGRGLFIPVLIYGFIIAVMLSLAVSVPASIFPRGLIVLFAAALFSVSDALLARNGLLNTGANITSTERGILSTCCYYLGQSLFAVSIYYSCCFM